MSNLTKFRHVVHFYSYRKSILHEIIQSYRVWGTHFRKLSVTYGGPFSFQQVFHFIGNQFHLVFLIQQLKIILQGLQHCLNTKIVQYRSKFHNRDSVNIPFHSPLHLQRLVLFFFPTSGTPNLYTLRNRT